MNHSVKVGRTVRLMGAGAIVAALLVLLLGPTRTARAEEDVAVNNGRISVSAGVDFVTQYWFRGLAQENESYIAQPWIELGVNLFSDDNAEFLNSVDIHVGIWNSFHGGPSGDGAASGSGITDPMAWYEADWYAGIGFTLMEKLSVGVGWTTYTSPNDAFTSTDEIALSFGYDDSGLWGDGFLASGLQPSFTVAFEYDGGADAGVNEGTYFELAFSPSWELTGGEYAVSLTVPMTFGFGSDYYEGLDSSGTLQDDAFGYFDVGADFSIPLAFIPSDFGSWSFTAGVHLLVLGDTASDIAGPLNFGVTGGENVEVYGIFGISMEY